MPLSGILLCFSQQSIERSRVGILFDLLVPLPVPLGVEPAFQARELVARQPGDGLFYLDDRTHGRSMPSKGPRSQERETRRVEDALVLRCPSAPYRVACPAIGTGSNSQTNPPFDVSINLTFPS